MAHRDKRLREAATLVSEPDTDAYDYSRQLEQRPVYIRMIPHMTFEQLVNLCNTSSAWRRRCDTKRELWQRWIDTHRPLMVGAEFAERFTDQSLQRWYEKLRTAPHQVSLGTYEYFERVLDAYFAGDLFAYANFLAFLLENILKRETAAKLAVPIVQRIIDAGLTKDGDDDDDYARFGEELQELFVRWLVRQRDVPPQRRLPESLPLLQQLWRAGPEHGDLIEFEGAEPYGTRLTLLQIATLVGNETAARLFMRDMVQKYGQSMEGKPRHRLEAHNRALHQSIGAALEQVKSDDADDDDGGDKKRWYLRAALSKSQFLDALRESGLPELMRKHDLRSPLLQE